MLNQNNNMIHIPALSIGNFASVINMVGKCGGEALLVDKPSQLKQAKKIILAGVGAFDQGMLCLKEQGWIDYLEDSIVKKKIPVLGICLGMHLFCNFSEEGDESGLGWINAHVRRFDLPKGSNLKIPHMGWNTVEISQPNPLLDIKEEEQRFYFVHSFHVECAETKDILAISNHGYEFCSAFAKENIFGVQFHPEKSHRFGMALMKNFVEMV